MNRRKPSLQAGILLTIGCLMLCMLFPLGSVRAEETGTEMYDEEIREALSVLKDYWERDMEDVYKGEIEPYVDIKNTRVITIKENPVHVGNENAPVEELKEIDSIIEFLMYSNYFGDTYPSNAGINDTVVVYRDGSMEVQKKSPLLMIKARYYERDYNGMIEEIIDLEDAYNGELF